MPATHLISIYIHHITLSQIVTLRESNLRFSKSFDIRVREVQNTLYLSNNSLQFFILFLKTFVHLESLRSLLSLPHQASCRFSVFTEKVSRELLEFLSSQSQSVELAAQEYRPCSYSFEKNSGPHHQR
ncbi:hypothetical protein CEXT_184061 [Caerostris extrusa]|uniref:Uncharacterized protein n=1 Tax=Caerostris extrusa TaxID=172846 RepID=A0AAV4UB13_CAEEX|nr:hypothetical protein CEXT_184061 [Caerostris extrusa]